MKCDAVHFRPSSLLKSIVAMGKPPQDIHCYVTDSCFVKWHHHITGMSNSDTWAKRLHAHLQSQSVDNAMYCSNLLHIPIVLLKFWAIAIRSIQHKANPTRGVCSKH